MMCSVISCLGFFPFYGRNLSLRETFICSTLFLILIIVLFYYYNKVSKKINNSSSQVDFPIYNSKDIFSQEIVGDSNFVLVEKTTSIWTKVTVFVLAFLIITTSVMNFLMNV